MAGALAQGLTRQASMRPGLECPGNDDQRGAVDRPFVLASMRPGLECPGNVVGQAQLHALELASMRPGLECPGNGIAVEWPLQVTELQ